MERPTLESSFTLPTRQRRSEIDMARGIAIILMMIFHLLYDLRTFGNVPVAMPDAYWRFMPEVIGTLFFGLLGVSAWLKFQEEKQSQLRWNFFKRGVRLFLIALTITAATGYFIPKFTIYFGVLHCISVSLMLLYPFLRFGNLNLTLGVIVIGATFFLQQYRFSFPWLMWIGFQPEKGTGGDWYPLIPWFGVVLLGIELGRRLYPTSDVRGPWSPLAAQQQLIFVFLAFLGRHSLVIYLIHQPIFIGSIIAFQRVFR